jgi:hypothetical protein
MEGVRTRSWLPQLERLPDFIGGFEASQEIRETLGERLCEIIVRREHSSDRCSDDTIAGVGLICR